jgi:hypothetical protein
VESRLDSKQPPAGNMPWTSVSTCMGPILPIGGRRPPVVMAGRKQT